MTGNPLQQELELPPRASSLVESLRDMGYSLRTALADVIDNSITAGAGSIRLFADTHHVSPAIGMLDDGAGMSQDELFEAMRPGTKSPLEIRSTTDLGRFGLGLKTASFLAMPAPYRRDAARFGRFLRDMGSGHGLRPRPVGGRSPRWTRSRPLVRETGGQWHLGRLGET